MNYLATVDALFPENPSGSARVAWDIVQAMRDRGHNVALLCRRQSPEAEDISEYEGIQVVRFSFPLSSSLDPFKVKKRIESGKRAAGEYLSNRKWDVIHIHLPIFGRVVYETFGDGPRYIYTVHSPSIMEQRINWRAQGLAGRLKLLFGTAALRRMEGGLLQKAEKIHTLSRFTKDKIDSFYGLGHKVSVISHWCRDSFVRKYSKEQARQILGWPKDATIFFTVRVMHIRYGLDIAIKAVAPILQQKKDIYFALAGDGPYKESFMHLAKELTVEDLIWFMGRIDDEMLKRCYEASDLFILPTTSLECFGLIVLEALAFGLPVISTDAAAIPELMEPILPQCIVSAGSVEELRKKIVDYLESRLDIPEPEAIIKYVKQKFNRQNILPQIVSLFES